MTEPMTPERLEEIEVGLRGVPVESLAIRWCTELVAEVRRLGDFKRMYGEAMDAAARLLTERDAAEGRIRELEAANVENRDRADKVEDRTRNLEHKHQQVMDAVDELRIGAWYGDTPFLAWSPGDDKPTAVPPRLVRGFYEAFKSKIEALGDWSRVAEAEARVRELEAAVQEAARLLKRFTHWSCGCPPEVEAWLDKHDAPPQGGAPTDEAQPPLLEGGRSRPSTLLDPLADEAQEVSDGDE